ncbi:MAG: S49 family peptidase [Bryobacterales bacterium]|nr:S49 family peptidase [Bryobacterales bacterium]
MESAAVRSVVLEIDSPGGELTGMNELAKLIAAARGSKPVLAYVGGMAASGAYWLASAADEIVADETAMLGSVGVVLTARRKDPQSAVVEIVSSQSPRKRLDAETPAGQAGLQELANELAGIFVRSIAGYRGVSEQHVLERFGKGGLLLGAKAVEAGMVDRIGTLEGVIAELQQGRKPKRASATAPGAAASVSTSGNRTAAPVKTEAQLEAETLAFINRTMRGKDGAEAEEQEFQQMRARFAPGQKPKRRSMAEIMAAEVEEAADGDSQTPLSNEDETKTLHFIEEVLKGAY